MKIGLLGGGTVGASVVRLLLERRNELALLAGEVLEPEVVLVRDGEKPRPDCLVGRITTDPERVVDDPGIAIVVEALGGVEPARKWTVRALRNGKSLVTANKALMAVAGPELFREARLHRAVVRFEAAVAASVPVMAALREVLTGERVEALAGILNGSTNYLLDAMEGGCPREEALTLAREAGYLEADPRDDLEGIDSARKLAILASVAWGEGIPLGALHVRGITEVEDSDVRLAAVLGRRLRLLAWAAVERGWAPGGPPSLALAVEPALLPWNHPLATLAGAASAVSVFGDPGGETLLAGSGAGGGPTALAVIGDLVSTARLLAGGGEPQSLPTLWDREIAPQRLVDRPGRYALRVEAPDGAPDVARLPLDLGASSHASSVEVVPADAATFWVLVQPVTKEGLQAVREALLHLPTVHSVGPALRLWDVPQGATPALFAERLGSGGSVPEQRPSLRPEARGEAAAAVDPPRPYHAHPGGDLS